MSKLLGLDSNYSRKVTSEKISNFFPKYTFIHVLISIYVVCIVYHSQQPATTNRTGCETNVIGFKVISILYSVYCADSGSL